MTIANSKRDAVTLAWYRSYYGTQCISLISSNATRSVSLRFLVGFGRLIYNHQKLGLPWHSIVLQREDHSSQCSHLWWFAVWKRTMSPSQISMAEKWSNRTSIFETQANFRQTQFECYCNGMLQFMICNWISFVVWNPLRWTKIFPSRTSCSLSAVLSS